jgi:branched-chain amino acid transport system permease protein
MPVSADSAGSAAAPSPVPVAGSRGAASHERPRRRTRDAGLLLGPPTAIVAVLVLLPSVLSPLPLLNVQSAIGLALFGCATNLLVGYGGRVSFGQGAFYGAGAYVIALAWLHLHMSFWISFICAPFVGAAVALVIGLIALRTRRLYFALLTLAFSQLLYVIVQQQVNFTGGANGVFGPMLPAFLLQGDNAYYFTLAVAVLGLLALWKITRSPFGMTLRAIRENPERAEALGVNVFRQQLLAFVFAGAFCALAGALFVVQDQSANPNLLSWTESGIPIFMAVIGGQFTFLGPALGALIYEQGRDVVLAQFSDWQLVFGLLLLLIVLVAPDGVLGVLTRVCAWLGHRLRAGTSGRRGDPGGDDAPGRAQPEAAGSAQ